MDPVGDKLGTSRPSDTACWYAFVPLFPASDIWKMSVKNNPSPEQKQRVASVT